MIKKRLARYLTISFVLTWTFWFVEAGLVKIGWLKASDFLAIVMLLLGGFGPTLAAYLTLPNGFSWKNLGVFLKTNKKGSFWILFCFASIEILFFALVSGGIEKSIPRSPLAVLVFLIIFIQATILFGGNEELGWRGIMHPILMKKLPRILVPLLIGAIWVCWHLPLWFIEGNSHQTMPFLSFAAFGLALSYWLSALMEMTDSVICTMVFHGLTNTLMGIFIVKDSLVYWIGVSILTLISIFLILSSDKNKTRNQLDL